jgi:hypothetical protein
MTGKRIPVDTDPADCVRYLLEDDLTRLAITVAATRIHLDPSDRMREPILATLDELCQRTRSHIYQLKRLSEHAERKVRA